MVYEKDILVDICLDFCGLFVFLYPLGNGLYERRTLLDTVLEE